MLGKASEAIPMFHQALTVMRNLIVLVEQPCHQANQYLQRPNQDIFCSSCVEPRIRGCQWTSLSSSSCPQQNSTTAGSNSITADTTKNEDAKCVNDHHHLNLSCNREKRTQHPMQDTAEAPSCFELYDEPLYIDFVPSDQERKQSNKENHATGRGGSDHSQQFIATIESRRNSINLLVAVSTLNTAIVYHRLSACASTSVVGRRRRSKLEDGGKRTAQRL